MLGDVLPALSGVLPALGGFPLLHCGVPFPFRGFPLQADAPPIQQDCAGVRVLQIQPTVVPAQVETQQRAVSPQQVVPGVVDGKGLIDAAAVQVFAGQAMAVVVAGRVKPPVLSDAQPGVQVAFAPDVVARCAFRRHFHSEIGRLAGLPDYIPVALPDGILVHIKSDIDIGLKPAVAVGRVVINDGVHIHEHIGAVGQDINQDLHHVQDVRVLLHTVGHRFRVGQHRRVRPEKRVKVGDVHRARRRIRQRARRRIGKRCGRHN